jgi:uncharacterized protein YdhG (YjbR/CyaY superfamily)
MDSASAVEQYLAALPARQRTMMRRVRQAVRAAAPGAEELIRYRMPAFRLDGMLVYYAAFADHYSFFVGSSTVRRRFAKEFQPFESGKGTLRFTDDRVLPLALIRRVVRARVAENRARQRSVRVRRPRGPSRETSRGRRDGP